jgi:hypothetical protein
VARSASVALEEERERANQSLETRPQQPPTPSKQSTLMQACMHDQGNFSSRWREIRSLTPVAIVITIKHLLTIATKTKLLKHRYFTPALSFAAIFIRFHFWRLPFLHRWCQVCILIYAVCGTHPFCMPIYNAQGCLCDWLQYIELLLCNLIKGPQCTCV